MSNRSVAGAGRWGRQLDELGAIAGLVLAVLLFPLRFLSSELFVQAVPLLIGFASALYLFTERYGREDVVAWRVSVPSSRGLRGLTLLGIGALGLTATTGGGRNALFFGVAGLVGSLLFAQILFVRERSLHPGFVVAQVVAFAVVLRFSALATTPGLIGIDGWTHVTTYAQAIRDAGSLSAIADVKYFAAPLYHLFAVVAAEAFNTSIRLAVYGTLGLVMPLSVVLVYLTTRHFLPVRWSLFAMAAYAVGDHVVRWGIHLIPTSMGLVFFLAIVWGITKLFVVDHEWPVFTLTVFVGLAVVLTHQISAFITLALLGAAVFTQLLVRLVTARMSVESVPATERSTYLGRLFFTFGAITVINWATTPYRSGTFMGSMIGNLQRTVAQMRFLDLTTPESTVPGALDGIVTSVPLSVQLVDALGFFLLLTAFILGTLTLVRSDRLSRMSLVYVVATAGMLVVTLGLPLFGVNVLIPGRWYAFMYVPMVIVATIGVRYVVTRLSSRGALAALLVVVLVFPGAMVVSHKATPGDPAFEGDYPRYAGTNAELAAVETISDIHPDSAGPIRTDHPYRTVFTRWQGQSATGFELSEGGLVTAEAAVYREYQSYGAPSARYDDQWVQVQLSQERVCGESSALLYANEEVRYCQSTTAP